MKKSLLSLMLLAGAYASSYAQPIANFEALTLTGADTFYVNHTSAGNDVGFSDSSIYFPTVFDEYSGSWYQASGFVYSNMRDTLTPGFTNQYAAIAGSGYLNSEKYAVAYFSPFADNYFRLEDAGATGHKLSGVAITNNTYAYLSMRDGDFAGKKFGGENGNDPDFFKVIFKGFLHGAPTGDSVAFYLADFRFEDSTQDYIVKDWQWVDLTALGLVDSVAYTMASSDTGSFGINTPTYFCIDNLTLEPLPVSVKNAYAATAIVYPNPARQFVIIESPVAAAYQLSDMMGRNVGTGLLNAGKQTISVQHLPAGTYVLTIRNGEAIQTIKISVEK